MNELHLVSTCSSVEKSQIIQQVQAHSEFDVFSYSVTKYPELNCNSNRFLRTDDQIIILFKNKPSVQQLNTFKQANFLEIIHQPSNQLPTQGNYSYIFKMKRRRNIANNFITTFEVCQKIFEDYSEIIYSAAPNFYYQDAYNCISENVLDPSGALSTWHINNSGGIVWNGENGLFDADADICECWDAGYTGEGVKIGVLDGASLEFDHPDLSNIHKAYDLSGPSAIEKFTNFSLNTNLAHSMNVLGTIGATPNNTDLGERWAAGIAYNSDLYAYIAPSINEADFIKGLQQALIDQIDILNMSFRMSYSASIDNAISNLANLGRPNSSAPNGAWGTVLIASTGNDDLIGSNFPANHVDVIGVGGSNPRDYRWSSNPPDGAGWLTSNGQGSTYGPPSYNYDVVAPSVLIMTVDAVNYGPQGSYSQQIGTSFASPIVSGICAIMLEKNRNQSNTTIREKIRAGAEKVHPDDYNYSLYLSAPGYNDEMFYGRVSCLNSLDLVSIGLEEKNKLTPLSIATLENHQFKVDIPENIKLGQIVVYTILGSRVLEKPINYDNELIIDLSNHSSGFYMVNVYNNNQIVGSAKIIR